MPRTLHPDLLDCMNRANPYVEYRVEIAEPDVSQVIRRPDQFLNLTTDPVHPGALVSMSPALSLSASARGGLILTPTDVPLANFTGTQSSFDLNAADTPDVRYKGLSWMIDKAFSQCTLMSIQAKVQAVPIAGFFFDQAFECQVYQITQIPGARVSQVDASHYTPTAVMRHEFAPLLAPAPTVKKLRSDWATNSVQTLNFPLTNFRLTLINSHTQGLTWDQTGIESKYLFVVRLTGQSLGGTGHYRWLTDTVTSRSIPNVGTFQRVFWSRANANSEWVEDSSFTDVPNFIF